MLSRASCKRVRRGTIKLCTALMRCHQDDDPKLHSAVTDKPGSQRQWQRCHLLYYKSMNQHNVLQCFSVVCSLLYILSIFGKHILFIGNFLDKTAMF